MTAAERYKKIAESRPIEIVDVKAPSGFIFKFKKPSKFALLFGAGELPEQAASEAVEDWEKQGLIQFDALDDDSKLKVGKKVFNIRDKVLFLSEDPKIVVGEAKGENEISTDDIDDADLEYLFKWVAAGGEVSAMTIMFPERRSPNALASAVRSKHRKKT